MPANFSFRIATLGDASATASGASGALAKCTRFAFEVPSWDVDGLYEDSLHSLPGETVWSIDLHDGRSEVGGSSIRLLYSSSVAGKFLRTKVAKVASAVADLSASGTSITLNTAGLEGETIIWGTEAILLGTETGVAPSVSYDVTSGRGVLGTDAQAHQIGPEGDPSVFLASRGEYLRGRRVELVRTPTGATGYGDEVVVWSGVLDNIHMPEPGIVALECRSFLSLVYGTRIRRKIWRARWTATSENSDGSVRWHYEGYPGLEPISPLSGYASDQSILVSLGGECVVKTTYLTIGSGDSAYSHLSITRGTPLFAESEPLPSDPPGEIWEVLSTHPTAPTDSGSPGVGTFPLDPRPPILALQLLTSTATGTNGSYDLGTDDLGPGVPVADIDTQSFLDAVEYIGSIGVQEHVHLGIDGESLDLGEFLEDLFRPYGLILSSGADGKITLIRFQDFPSVGSPTSVTMDLLVQNSIPFWERYGLPVVRDVQARYRERPASDPLAATFVSQAFSERVPTAYGVQDELTLNGMSEFDRAKLLAIAHLFRFSSSLPRVSAKFIRSLDLWPGDIVLLSSDFLPGGDGTRGIDSVVAIVTTRSLSWGTNEVRYSFILVGLRYNRTGLIAPCVQVNSYDNGTLTVTPYANATVSTNNPNWSNDTEALEYAWDQIQGNFTVEIWDANLDYRGYGTVNLVDSTVPKVVFASAPSVNPVQTDWLVLANYSTVEGVSPQELLWDLWAYLANDSEQLGADLDDGYDMTT